MELQEFTCPFYGCQVIMTSPKKQFEMIKSEWYLSMQRRLLANGQDSTLAMKYNFHCKREKEKRKKNMLANGLEKYCSAFTMTRSQ